ncbi:MAG: OmpH family outer membrane protein [Deltaproteobacteria bacterium]|nr:OmpH family outer membrane protein [Deltaproteobacteria bacterium]
MIIRLFFSLLLLTASPLAAADLNELPPGPAFIRADTALRENPAEAARIIAPLGKDTKVEIKLQHKDWVKVEVPEISRTGWVHFTQLHDKPPAAPTPKTVKAKVSEPGLRKNAGKNGEEEKRATSAPASGTARIGVIDIQQVINQSKRGREAREKFEALRRAGGEQQNMDGAEEKIISGIITEIHAIVETHAAQKGLTHILNENSGSIFFHDGSTDITDDIIKEYDRQATMGKTSP